MTELELSAERLLKWDRRRNLLSRVLRYDLRDPVSGISSPDLRARTTGEPRTIPAMMVAFGVWRANDYFCQVAADNMGVEMVGEEEDIPPHLRRPNSSFEDPLLRFPNGLILNTVDAADHVLQLVRQ